MIRIMFLLLFIFSFQMAYAVENNCITCHQDFEDENGSSYKFIRDIHFQKGLGCVDCHGGDALLEDMDDVREVKGYLGVPTYREVPEFCARCHSDAAYMRNHNPLLPTDQLAKYKTSTHGQRLYKNKDTKVANCVSCHTVHEIGDAKMPHSSTNPLNIPTTCGNCHSNPRYMAEYDIPTTQKLDYKQSVHGIALLQRNDLGAPACNDCHGNHGAAPPGVSSVTAVCGNCHAIEADLFNASPHKEAFEASGYPMCETCHSNHKIIKPYDAMVGSEEPALCTECHSPEDGTKGLETAKGISKVIKELVVAHNEAREVLDKAVFIGMMTTDEEFRFKEVKQALIQARTLVHSYNLDSVLKKGKEGIRKANTIKTNSLLMIEEYYFRRKGLGFATLFITIFIIALYIKIKRVDEELSEE